MSRTLIPAASAALLAGAAGLHHDTGTVTIVCRFPGMRRNGVRHPAVETYPADRWTVDELDAFEADPNFTVRYEAFSSSAPGASTADAVQDQGAGAPTPDLGAKPDGTGPSAPIVRADGVVVPGVLDQSRVEAIRGRLQELGVFMVPAGQDPGARVDFLTLDEEQWTQAESLLGFRPTPAEMDAATDPAHFGAQMRTLEADTQGAASALAPVGGEHVTPGALVDGSAPLGGSARQALAVHSSTAVEAIRSVLGRLVAPADFTAGGKPKLDALEALLGFAPTRAEVDIATKVEPDPAA